VGCDVVALTAPLCKVDIDGLFLTPTGALCMASAADVGPTDVMILCGLKGVALAELNRLALRECCTPCTMDV